MSTSITEVQTAWEQFQTDMKSLRDELRRHYEPASSPDPALQASLHKLGQAADEKDEELQGRFGGKTFFGDYVPPKLPPSTGGYL